MGEVPTLNEIFGKINILKSYLIFREKFSLGNRERHLEDLELDETNGSIGCAGHWSLIVGLFGK